MASSLPDLLSDSVTAGRRGRHTGNQGRQSGRRVRGETRGPDRPANGAALVRASSRFRGRRVDSPAETTFPERF